MTYIDEDRAKSDFDDMLNESYPEVEIEGISFDPARILKMMYEVAYDESLSAYLDERGMTTDENDAD